MYNKGQIRFNVFIKVLERQKLASPSLQEFARIKCIKELSGQWLNSVVQPGPTNFYNI
jgi:hypothetical protein